MRSARLAAFAALALAACEAVEEAAPPPPAVTAPGVAMAPLVLSEFFDCVRREGATLIAAHRGGPAPGYPENALATFARTSARTPALLEVDVNITRDGALVLMHDDTVERTTNGTGRVDQMTRAEFAALSLEGSRDGEAPPTLQQALDWAEGRAILELDIKQGVPFEAVVEAVQRAVATERVVMIVYSTSAAIRLHRLEPDLMISVPIATQADLERLRRARVPLDRILAWTGVAEADADLNAALAARGVEVLFGALGGGARRDDPWTGRDFAALREEGVHVIAADDVDAAWRAIDDADGEGWAAARCLR